MDEKLQRAVKEGGRGVLIAFEGIDGTGKTTQATLLSEYLNNEGYPVILTKEPTDGEYGQKIRNLYVSRAAISAEEELDWFIKDRQEHVEKVIRPALDQGCVVITDRYYFSTMAYQGVRSLSVDVIRKMNEVFAPEPDLVILLTGAPRLSLERIRNSRQETPNSFEKEDYLKRVQEIFLSLPDETIIIVDAERPFADIQREIRNLVKSLLLSRPHYAKSFSHV